MKAIVVKNNQFETIGFEVISNGRTLFSWGISSTLKTNFQKEINVNDWMVQIFDLVRLQATLEEQERETGNFFKVGHENKVLVEGIGYNIIFYQKQIEESKRKIENIVKNII